MACVGADTSRGVRLRAVARSPGPARRQGCKGPLAGSRGQARCEGQPELDWKGKTDRGGDAAGTVPWDKDNADSLWGEERTKLGARPLGWAARFSH